jgi:VIT1/CCC1 family predicted Fe2+/Mn2+ transporter
MSDNSTRENFFQRHLDPASRLGEILFGLIMVLGATLTAGLTVAEGEKGVRQLLHAAIGCNLAWGIIDGVMYVMNCVVVRSGRARFLREVQCAPDAAAAEQIIRDEVEPEIGSVLGSEVCESLYQSVRQHLGEAGVPENRITREDLNGAFACFWLVFLSCLPAAVPFLIFSSPIRALRVSNFLLLAMLFIVGQRWAWYVNLNRLFSGLVMVAIGLVLVGVAVLLGG